MKQTKIILINPPGWVRDNVNLGLCHLSAAVKNAGYQCKILDLNLFPSEDSDVISFIKNNNPNVVGISVKTATSKEGARLASVISKAFPEKIIIAGGPHVTIDAKNFLKENPQFTFGVMSEAEISLVEILNAIENNRSYLDIHGLAYLKNEEVNINPWSPPPKLDELPTPDFFAVEDFDPQASNFFYPILSSRGCPYECIFCCVPDLAGSRKWRARSVKSFVDEMEMAYKNLGIRHFEIWDDNFTLHLPRAKQICKEIIERRLNITWACHNGIRADRVDEELAELMYSAGCIRVAFGIESGNISTFDKIKKGEPLSAVVNAVKTMKAANIDVIGYFIIGLPGDTLNGFIETIRFQRSLGLTEHLYGMMVPYPKTEAWDIVNAEGKFLKNIAESTHYLPDDSLAPISFEMPNFTKLEMEQAYFLAKAFPVFECAEKIRISGKVPKIIFQNEQQIYPYMEAIVKAAYGEAKAFILEKDGFLDSSPIPHNSISFIDKFPDCLEDCILVGEIDFLLERILTGHRNNLLYFAGSKGCLVEERLDQEGNLFVAEDDLSRLADFVRKAQRSDSIRNKVRGKSASAVAMLEDLFNFGFAGNLVDDWVGRELLITDQQSSVGFDRIESSGVSHWRWALGCSQSVKGFAFSRGIYRLYFKVMLPSIGAGIKISLNGKILFTLSATREREVFDEHINLPAVPTDATEMFFEVESTFSSGLGSDKRPLAYVIERFEIKKINAATEDTEDSSFSLSYKERKKQIFREHVDSRM